MASGYTEDECDICTELLKQPRVLHCNHIFCLDCLEKLEYKKSIKCPTCRKETNIKPGMQVKHLRKKIIKPKLMTSAVTVVTSWITEQYITDVTIDDDTGVIFLATTDKEKPIKMYDMMGEYTGYLSADVGLDAARLGLDTKRGLLLAVNDSAIVMFDREGMQVGTIRCPEFKRLNSIAYHGTRDIYIVADIRAHCLYYINPNNYKVVKTIPAATKAEIQSDTSMHISCDKSGQVSVWATSDFIANTVRLYDADGSCIKVWNKKGSGYGQFWNPGGVYIDNNGIILVSDASNHRIIRLDPECKGEMGEWQVIVDTKQFGLGAPRDIDMTEDGLAAVVMWTKPPGPFNLALINGLLQQLVRISFGLVANTTRVKTPNTVHSRSCLLL